MSKFNRLDKSFGPVGSTAGMMIFTVGLIMLFFSYTAVILMVFGAFIGFSTSAASVDSGLKRVKFAIMVFGLIPVGKWIYINGEMSLRIKKSQIGWRTYSRGNRTLDIVGNDYRIVLYNENNEEIMPVKKFKDKEIIQSELENLSKQLGIRMIG